MVTLVFALFQVCMCVRRWTAMSFMIGKPRRTRQSAASTHTGTRLEFFF